MTIETIINGEPKTVRMEFPDEKMMRVIELLEADADAQAGRTLDQGIEARKPSNLRADYILAERDNARKKVRK